MTSPSERGLTGEPFTRGFGAPSDPSAPAHSATPTLEELAGRVQVATALKRRVLAYGESIDPFWSELADQEIDRRLDDLFRAALIPVRRRAVSTTTERRAR